MDKPPVPGMSIKVLIYEADKTARHDKLGEIIIEPNPESESREHKHLNRQSYQVSYYAETVKYAKVIGFQMVRPTRDLVVEAFKSLGFVK